MSVDCPLRDRIADLIRATGPMPVGQYMALCLSDPQHGYYRTREPFGVEGDFITAPEISQMFGELVGLWLAGVWDRLGRPSPFVLAEIGPGRGTLMKDALRAVRRAAPAFFRGARVHLVETSPRLRAVQRATLRGCGRRVVFAEMHSDLPDLPLFLVANELFDAIPAQQIIRTADGWRERVVGLDAAGRLCFGAGTRPPAPGLLPIGEGRQPEGAIHEYAPAREALAAEIAERLVRSEGAALIIDYGHAASGFGDTLQALHGGRPDDPLAHPGRADLTTHVDFAALAQAMRGSGAHVAGPVGQGNFLLAVGLLERAGALGHGKPPETQDAIRAAVERLAGPDQMGTLFKAMAASWPRTDLPGFPEAATGTWLR